MNTDPHKACANEREELVWAIVHDLIAHPLMAITRYSRPALRWHDFTSHRAWPRAPEAEAKAVTFVSCKYGAMRVRQLGASHFGVRHGHVGHEIRLQADSLNQAIERAEEWFDSLAAEFGGPFAPRVGATNR